MNIGGFYKLSLIDYPGKVAAIVFTQGCAFACRYCHNPELIKFKKESSIDQEEILCYLKRKKYFLDGVVITGGEPTLQKNLIDFIENIKDIDLKVKLDTSGVNPTMIKEILDKKLVDYFAMDIKHVWEKYEQVTQISNERYMSYVKETFSLIQNSNVDHEFRTTVFPEVHKEEDFFTIASYLLPKESYNLQQIRYLKVLDPNIKTNKFFDLKKVISLLEQQYPLLSLSCRE